MTAINQVVKTDIVTAIVEGRADLWLSITQEEGPCWDRGRYILAGLRHEHLLECCADRAELEAIQAEGIDFFRKYFSGKAIFGWRGVRDGNVPFLCEESGDVVLLERDADFDSCSLFEPALFRLN